MTARRYIGLPRELLEAAVSDRAVRVWAILAGWAWDHRTDGWIAPAALGRELPTRADRRALDELVAAGEVTAGPALRLTRYLDAHPSLVERGRRHRAGADPESGRSQPDVSLTPERRRAGMSHTEIPLRMGERGAPRAPGESESEGEKEKRRRRSGDQVARASEDTGGTTTLLALPVGSGPDPDPSTPTCAACGGPATGVPLSLDPSRPMRCRECFTAGRLPRRPGELSEQQYKAMHPTVPAGAAPNPRPLLRCECGAPASSVTPSPTGGPAVATCYVHDPDRTARRLTTCSVCDAERLCADDCEGHPVCDRCTSPAVRAKLAELTQRIGRANGGRS